ncbi:MULTISPECIES: hypothetical protein [unclassified Acinetobacter]|uniref:hypothetical protein n=1 Tax=unclassified Acinetobacter TaxID=196816 RepID=UPI002934AE1C|nr:MULTISPECIES: hypothetical protein [unclassified Acinetobacter]WOE32761.1 hypothetical protein QSG84_06185 [Acinetobacter sp. SAAs470]WOE38238.1 hypothetical protein QSG86_15240 [Acinetobacter sp. SAAs474]
MSLIRKLNKAKIQYEQDFSISPNVVFINLGLSEAIQQERPDIRWDKKLCGMDVMVINDMECEFVVLRFSDIDEAKRNMHNIIDGYIVIEKPMIKMTPYVSFGDTPEFKRKELKIPLSVLR